MLNIVFFTDKKTYKLMCTHTFSKICIFSSLVKKYISYDSKTVRAGKVQCCGLLPSLRDLRPQPPNHGHQLYNQDQISVVKIQQQQQSDFLVHSKVGIAQPQRLRWKLSLMCRLAVSLPDASQLKLNKKLHKLTFLFFSPGLLREAELFI